MATVPKRRRTISIHSTDSEEDGEKEYEVEVILSHRCIDKEHEFLVKWDGWPEDYCTWEPLKGLMGCNTLIEDYIRRTHQSTYEPVIAKTSKTKVKTKTKSKRMGHHNPTPHGRALRETRRENSVTGPLVHTLSPTVRLQRANVNVPSKGQIEKDFMDIGRKACRKSTRKQTNSVSYKKVFPSPSSTSSSSSSSRSVNSGRNIHSNRKPTPSLPPVQVEVASLTAQTLTSRDRYDHDDPKVVTVLTVLPKGKEIYKIHGVVNVTGNLTLLVEWDNDERDLNLVDSKILNLVYPQKVIQFYQKHLQLQRHNGQEDDTNSTSTKTR